MEGKTYLGDSVYVEVENGMFKLTTDNGEGPSNTIYMEYEVYEALVQYVARVTGAEA
jgi:hypothetical protein